MRRRIVLITVSAIALILTGCGNNPEESTLAIQSEPASSIEPAFERVLNEAKTAKEAHAIWKMTKAGSIEQQAASDRTSQLAVAELRSAKTAEDIDKTSPYVIEMSLAAMELRLAKARISKQ